MAYLPLFYLGKAFPAARVTKQNRAPATTDSRYDVGTIWADLTNGLCYICEKNVGGVATWKSLGGSGFIWQHAVLSKVVNQAGAVAAEGNRYISPAAGATWLENYIYEYKAGSWEETAPVEGMVCYIDDINEVDIYDGAAWDNLVSPVTTLAGLTDCEVVAPADKQLLVYVDASSKWTNLDMSGDIVISATGATSFNGSPIVNADVNAAAAIDFSKLASLTEGNILVGNATNVVTALDASGDAKILIGNGTTLTSQSITGDVTLLNTGATTVTGITLGADAQGDIYYRGAAALARLGAGVAGQALVTAGAGGNPYWGTPSVGSASALANSVTCEAGANDYTLAFGAAGGAYTLTIPAVAGSRTFAFINEAQTWGAVQKFTNVGLSALDVGGVNTLILKPNETNAADRTLNIKVNDADRTIDITGNLTLAAGLTTATDAITLTATAGGSSVTLPTAGTVATLDGVEAFTNKTITSGVLATSLILEQVTDDFTISWADPAAARTLSIADPLGNDTFVFEAAAQTLSSKTLTSPIIGTSIVLDQATADYTVVFSDPAAARQLTIGDPAGDDDFVFEDMAQTLTSKIMDAASNTFSNFNAQEMEVAAAAGALGMAVPFIVKKDISNALTTTIYAADFPLKASLVKAWVVETGAGNSGDVTIDDGANVICGAESYTGTDTKVVNFTTIDDAFSTLAAGASLRALNSVNTDDAFVYLMFIPIA
jgi:hypothetical protein